MGGVKTPPFILFYEWSPHMVNIFVTSRNPKLAAQHMSDLLVPRMALEAAEILCGAQWAKLSTLTGKPPKGYIEYPWYSRNVGQRNHPICKWAGEDKLHYAWLYLHYIELLREYEHRFPDRNKLKCGDQRKQLKSGICLFKDTRYSEYSRESFKEIKFLPTFSHDFPKSFKSENTCQLYRASMMYRYNWIYVRCHKWTNRTPPAWVHVTKEAIKLWSTLGGSLPNTPTHHHLRKIDGG